MEENKMGYYLLNKNIALRSWQLVPYAYYIYGVRAAKGLNKEQFELLLRCDGKQDIPDSPQLQELSAFGLCHPCKKGEVLTDWQKHRTYDNRYFPHMNWAITGKCNFNCLHCFMAADNAPMMEEFTWEECLKLLDECVRCGVQSFTLTGGEPMLHPRFMDLMRECAKRRLCVSGVNTNGSFLTDEMLDEWKSLGLNPQARISYDGVGHHDWMRNVPSAEEKALNAIRLCKKHGFQVRVHISVHRGNLDVLFDTVKLLDSLGVEKVWLIRTSETPRWQENAQGMCLGLKEYYDEMLELMRRLISEKLNIQVDAWQFAYYNPLNKTYHFHPVQAQCGSYRDSIPLCRGARGTIAVAHTGKLSPCNQMAGLCASMGVGFGNVKKQSLHELLSESSYLDMITTPVSAVKERNPECQSCQYWSACMGGCRAIATAFTKDMLHADPSKCVFFKDGYMKKIDDAFTSADPEYRCGSNTGEMDRAGDPKGLAELSMKNLTAL